MKLKLEKCVQIMSDLVIYCHSIGALDYHVDIEPVGEIIKLRIQAKVENLSEETLNELKEAMAQHRQQEIEFNYWSISYDTGMPLELTSLGMMLDDVIVEYDGERLMITASR